MKPHTTLPGVAVLVSLFAQSAHAAPFPSRTNVVRNEQDTAAKPLPIVYKNERGLSNEHQYSPPDPQGHPTVFPFPTDISYLTFYDRPGATHPPYPHLDISKAGFKTEQSSCWYHNKPCEGIPHIPIPKGFDSLEKRSPASHRYPPAPIKAREFANSTSASNSGPNTSTVSATPCPSNSPPSTMAGQDIFQPIAKDPIPASIKSRGDHPVKTNHIEQSSGPISTNKFYANFFLGNQTSSTFTHPYSMIWAKGDQNTSSFGMAISHVEPSQRATGEPNSKLPGDPARYYINPIGIKSFVLSASELKESTTMSVAKPKAFSAQVILRPKGGASESITFPLVQGMGFITAIYNNLKPTIQSGVLFRKVEPAGSPQGGIFKYKVTLEDDKQWLLYVTPENGSDPKLKLENNKLISGPTGFKGVIQVAKNPSSQEGEAVYDKSAGSYATNIKISGSVASDGTGTYKFSFEKAGKGAPLVMYALPHHVESFDDGTKKTKKNMKLSTTTKGMATACVGDSWTMVERNLPLTMDFAPWKPGVGSQAALSEGAKSAIRAVAGNELSQDMEPQTNLNSMYFSGKGLNKFAGAIYTVHELVGDKATAAGPLNSLKESFKRFVENKQQIPLVYDTVWKGVVSSGTYEKGDPGLDFGNTLYNDHHFHYGYFILAASIIGKMDPAWLNANKAYVNMLVRDSGNSVENDELFPFSRAFDWYHGHSWAKGLFESADGKDQESTSEDTMYAYAIKMWGKTSGDKSMEARGNLMLGILARSLNNYFLMKSDNVNQPKNFIGNKVTGILFENKIDHTTYFGANLEYIQGIASALPNLPNSAYTRSAKFVKEEWDAIFASRAAVPAEKVTGGWKGVLYANLAIIDPQASWKYFAQPSLDLASIDGGASRIWYLAYAAGKSPT
ncbi:endo-1,3(4)-beta-glucanase 1 [Nannizzia gypsea CBS 118893]|uniref:glucan endo-1,3-beta-D-glucosidase n=1 Tax=Arthroderma gypseum (strain ATCC MYA-4604 / CBS 118893) TaxID=535722 RepID=E4UQP3_ARTGP|nr:endo-1,3(4)-beta-glucanase 1 [Nannizzia gypsea CBS 118893]EFR00061.1 endo-1,3(4)-beta-glucanase 1 [Nannizzia gypsea CBS 118893]